MLNHYFLNSVCSPRSYLELRVASLRSRFRFRYCIEAGRNMRFLSGDFGVVRAKEQHSY
jgi:hypothetical protein